MSHCRKQARDAVASLLNASPKRWRKAFATRFPPQRDIGDYLLVFVGDDSIDPLDIHPGHSQWRTLRITVIGRTRPFGGNENGEKLENALDGMAVEIEETLTSATLRAELAPSKSAHLKLVSISTDMEEDEQDRRFAELQMQYDLRIMTVEGAPETIT